MLICFHYVAFIIKIVCVARNVNKLKVYSSKETLIVPDLNEIGPLAIDKKPFKCCHCNFPLKGNDPSFEQTWVPFTYLCTVDWNWPSGV